MCSFARVAAQRPCVYPNVGFQLQLCLFERHRFNAPLDVVDLPAEIAVSVDGTLANVEDQMDAMFDDGALLDDPSRWMDFGFFFQNCREYLGHLDLGLPTDLLAKAEDVARRLKNLELVFDGEGVNVAARVGRVLDVWRTLQQHIAAAPGALPRIDLGAFRSVIAATPRLAPGASHTQSNKPPMVHHRTDAPDPGPATFSKRDRPQVKRHKPNDPAAPS